jgi:hypothetical protein
VKRLENDGSPIAEQALRQIAELYAIEASVRGHAPGARLAARTKLAAPIIAAFRPWLEAQLSRIPQSTKLAEDIRYTLGIWPGLSRFLEDGRLELDTNPVENQIRPIALTRKNALFAGNEVGAENWAMRRGGPATAHGDRRRGGGRGRTPRAHRGPHDLAQRLPRPGARHPARGR